MVLLLLLLTPSLLYAQRNLPHFRVPTDSKITLEEAGELIYNYQKKFNNPRRPYPNSYIINVSPTSAFYSYLASYDFEFLQIYFMKDNDGKYLLGITGVNIDPKTFKRINQDNVTGAGAPTPQTTSLFCAVATYSVGTTSCVNYDQNLDYNVNAPAPWTPNPAVTIPPAEYILAGIDPNDATKGSQKYIGAFQDENYLVLSESPANWYPQSFLIRADKLINNLILNQQMQEGQQVYAQPMQQGLSAQGTQALEFYLGDDAYGINNQPPYNSAPASQRIKLIIAGVDATGNHIYYVENNLYYAFEEILPCPVCGVEPDPLLERASSAKLSADIIKQYNLPDTAKNFSLEDLWIGQWTQK